MEMLEKGVCPQPNRKSPVGLQVTRKRELTLKWEKLYSSLETKRTVENGERVK